MFAVTFKALNSNINIIGESNLTIKELFKRYFLKINEPELINNYEKKLFLLFKGEKLEESKTLFETFKFNYRPLIVVIEKNIIRAGSK